MSDTPRTDALKIPSEAMLLVGQKGIPEQIVKAMLTLGDHARQLERELAEANAKCDYYWQQRAEQVEAELKAERELAANKEVLRVTELHKGLMALADERYHQALDELAEAKRDAERIDWLEENVSAIRDIGWLGGVQIRSYIDTAMRAKEG